MESDALGLRPEFLREPARFSAIPYVVETLQRASEREALERDLARVEGGVRRVVDSNYAGLTNSVREFSAIADEFLSAQDKVRRLKEYVARSKGALVSRKRNLKDLWFQRVQHERTLLLLRQMDEVRQAPHAVEVLLAKGQVVECADAFLRAYELSLSDSMVGIGALKEVRAELVAYRERLHEELSQRLLQFLAVRSGGGSGDGDGSTSTSVGVGVGVGSAELGATVAALARLRRLPQALYEAKRRLRDQLQHAKLEHVARARARLSGLGESSEAGELRLRDAVRGLAGCLSDTLARHAQFHRLLLCEGEAACKLYSLTETWSAMQGEVQELVELHVREAPGAAPRADEDEGVRVQFRFSDAQRALEATRRRETLLSGAGEPAGGAASGRQLLLCEPSPYRLLGLLGCVVPFVQGGDAVCRAASKLDTPRLLVSVVKELCVEQLLPRLLADATAEVAGATAAPFAWDVVPATDKRALLGPQLRCVTPAGAALCSQLLRVAAVADLLVPLELKADAVVLQLLVRFADAAQAQVDACVDAKASLCGSWLAALRGVLKEDPGYLALLRGGGGSSASAGAGGSSGYGSGIGGAGAGGGDASRADKPARALVAAGAQQPDDDVSGRVSAAAFTASERAEERRLGAPALALRLLTPGQMERLAAIYATCDLVLRSLHDNQGSLPPAFYRAVARPAMAAALAAPRARAVLARLDQAAESALFALRCELRARCVQGLRRLPLELAQAGDEAEQGCAGLAGESSAVALAQALVQCARALDKLDSAHASYLLRQLCPLLAETVVRALQHAPPDAPPPPKKRTLKRAHVRFLARTAVLLQQTMWTVLLNVHENSQGARWTAARDQLAAFDGARQFLQSFDAHNAHELANSLDGTVHALAGSLQRAELEHIRGLFDPLLV
jgi:hypothetical protein